VRSSSIGTLWTTLSQKGLAARRAYGVYRPYVLCAAGSGLSLPRSLWRDADASNASWIIARNGEDTPSARARLERPSRATARSARKSRSRATPTRCRARAGGIFCAQAVEGLDSKLPSQCTPSRCPRGRAAGTLVHGHEAIDRAAAAVHLEGHQMPLASPPELVSGSNDHPHSHLPGPQLDVGWHGLEHVQQHVEVVQQGAGARAAEPSIPPEPASPAPRRQRIGHNQPRGHAEPRPRRSRPR